MSTQAKAEFVDEELSESTVHDYLAEHPDFFERHGALLGSLRLPHVAGGAVSLVERQVSVLRQKDLKLERQLKELLEVARANDGLAEKIHRLALALIAADDLGSTLTIIEESLRTAFDANQSILVLFGNPELFKDITSMPGVFSCRSNAAMRVSRHSTRFLRAADLVVVRSATPSGIFSSAKRPTKSAQPH